MSLKKTRKEKLLELLLLTLRKKGFRLFRYQNVLAKIRHSKLISASQLKFWKQKTVVIKSKINHCNHLKKHSIKVNVIHLDSPDNLKHSPDNLKHKSFKNFKKFSRTNYGNFGFRRQNTESGGGGGYSVNTSQIGHEHNNSSLYHRQLSEKQKRMPTFKLKKGRKLLSKKSRSKSKDVKKKKRKFRFKKKIKRYLNKKNKNVEFSEKSKFKQSYQQNMKFKDAYWKKKLHEKVS